MSGMALAIVLCGGAANAAPPAQWTSRPPLNVARVGAAYATVDGHPWVAAGFNFDDPEQLTSVEARSGTGAWHLLSPIPTGRANAGGPVLRGKVWVIGGDDAGDPPVGVVEIYDPRTGGWSAGPSLPAGRAAAGAAVLDGVLYVAGGYLAVGNDEEVTATALAYEPRLRRWTPIAPLPSARGRLRLAAVGGYLYAIGGQNAADDTVPLVDRYDPRSGTWRSVAAMHEDRGLPGVTVFGSGRSNRIAVIGGCHFAGGVLVELRRTTEVYDPAIGRWRLLAAQLPTGRCSLSAAAETDGTVLAIGGAADTGPDGAAEPTAAVDALRVTATG